MSKEKHGKCVFCGKFGLLENSHIISNFHIKEFKALAVQNGVKGPLTKIVSCEGDKNVNLQSGLKGYLLCGCCEDNRSVFENGFSKEFKINRKSVDYKNFFFENNAKFGITSLHTSEYVELIFNKIFGEIGNDVEIEFAKNASFFYGNDFDKIVKHLCFTLYMLSFEPRVSNINLSKKELNLLHCLIEKNNLVVNDLKGVKISMFRINDYVTFIKNAKIINRIDLSGNILSRTIKKFECNMYQFVIPGFLVIIQLGSKVKQDSLALFDYKNGWGVIVPCTNGFLAKSVVNTLHDYRKIKKII